MHLSKSKYIEGIQCKKILWLNKYHPEEKTNLNNESVLEQGDMVHEVARYLFKEHINITYTENLKQMISDTYNTIESYQDIVITEASFNYQNNFCSIDILKKQSDNFAIYEVKSSTKLKDVYLQDAAYQYYVLTNLGFKVTNCYLVVLNNNYIRQGPIDLEKLFLKQDITAEVLNLQSTVATNLLAINEYMQSAIEPRSTIDINCFKPYPCPYFNYCTKHLSEYNVFKLANMSTQKKISLYHDNLAEYPDLLKCQLSDKYHQQILYDLYNYEPHIDKEKIKTFLSSLTYPLYFLDFETYQMPIPLYDNLSPYEKVPFQYSLHYLESPNSKLLHKEFLSPQGIDPRRNLAEQLVKDIPQNCQIIAYNMAFEKSVIKKLAQLYPDLSNHLLNLYDNFTDLMIPFKERYYYTKEMHGSYSIKAVLPALFPDDPSLNYQSLELVHNGQEATQAYLKSANLSDEELNYTRKRLLKYCELDTYAMVKIFEKLQEIIK